jgi:tetratricopeptide (TPR) repeat protein
MKRFLIYTILLFASVSATMAQPTSAERWEMGNKAYMDGAYDKAVEEYSAILEGGEYSMELYYNLANAYFKSGKLGEAILYYNKAAKLSPNDDDVAYNLAYAQSFIKDKIESVPTSGVARVVGGVGNLMGADAWGVVSLVLLGLALVCGALYLLLVRRSARKASFVCAVVFAALTLVAVAYGAAERGDLLAADEAVVLSSAAAVKSSPERSSKDLFILHEGTKVEVLDEFGSWREIRIADGNKGWIQSSAIEVI